MCHHSIHVGLSLGICTDGTHVFFLCSGEFEVTLQVALPVAQVGPRARGSGMGQKNERFCYASFHI